MKLKLIFALLLFPALLQAQTNYSSFIMGEGVRIRSTGSAKGTEVSKVHGKREVLVIEESNKRDDLGTKNLCESYPWVKVRWEGDSTGWVFGKYLYFYQADESSVASGTEFTYQNITYKVLSYKTNSAPIDDENGLTGCGWGCAIVFFDTKNNKYYFVNDTKSKEGKTIMTFYNDEGGGEGNLRISVENNNIIGYADYSLQDGGGSLMYTIKYSAGKFTVIDFKKTLNND